MCWLYSMPNLLVIQHVETLYLGGNNVRVMCERVWRNSSCMHLREILWLDLATDLQLASRQSATRVKHVGSRRVTTTEALQDKKVQFGLAVNSRLKHVTRSSREVEWPECPVLLKSNFSHSISYPPINTLIPMKCIELIGEPIKRKTLRKVSTTHPCY